MAIGFRPLAGVLFAALLAAAPAAAQPAPPVYSWTGLYVGASVGSASGRSNVTSFFTCLNPGACAYGPADFGRVGVLGSGPFSDRSFTGGVQVGHNWQAGYFVAGFEGDFSALKLRGSRTLTARVIGEAANNYWVTTHIDASGIMTVRGRLGVTPVPAVLLYATGGAAVTSFTVSNHFVDDASTIIGLTVNSIGQSNATRKKWGWTAGGGAEWAVARSWTIRAEYLYFDFGSIGTIARVIQTDVAPDDPNHLATSASLTVRMVRVGFNARF